MNPSLLRTRRALAVFSIAALVITSLSATGPASAAVPRANIGAWEYYISYAEPAVQADFIGQELLSGPAGLRAQNINRAKAYNRKFGKGNPLTAKLLAEHEAKSMKSGKNPSWYKKAKNPQVAKLLTVLVEFNDQANDDFTGVQVPATVFEDRTCVA